MSFCNTKPLQPRRMRRHFQSIALMALIGYGFGCRAIIEAAETAGKAGKAAKNADELAGAAKGTGKANSASPAVKQLIEESNGLSQMKDIFGSAPIQNLGKEVLAQKMNADHKLNLDGTWWEIRSKNKLKENILSSGM